MRTKTLKLPASLATIAEPVAQPLGPATISGATITVDYMANNPTIIPGMVRNLAAANRGYFADKVFRTPGTAVTGGIVIAEPTKPNELFLPTDQSLAPRAPGAEAPRVGATRGEPVAYYPESIAGSLEITDEARERNSVATITRQLQQIANTFTNTVQLRALEVLKAWTEAETSARTKANKTNWKAAAEVEDSKAKLVESPWVDFAYVEQLFAEDEAGESLATVILNPTDYFNLVVATSETPGLLSQLLSQGGWTIYTSPRVPAGEGYFLAGPIGDLLYEKPLGQNSEYDGKRWTTVISMEMRPVFVPTDYLTVFRLTGLAT